MNGGGEMPLPPAIPIEPNPPDDTSPMEPVYPVCDDSPSMKSETTHIIPSLVLAEKKQGAQYDTAVAKRVSFATKDQSINEYKNASQSQGDEYGSSFKGLKFIADKAIRPNPSSNKMETIKLDINPSFHRMVNTTMISPLSESGKIIKTVANMSLKTKAEVENHYVAQSIPERFSFNRAIQTKLSTPNVGKISNFVKVENLVSGGAVTVTIAGSGTAGLFNGYPRTARFYYPISVAVDSSNNIYVADFYNHAIRKIDASNRIVSTVTSTDAKLYYPGGVAVNNQGDVYIADSYHNQIKKYSKDGLISIVAGTGAAGRVDGQGGSASFYRPMGIAVSEDNSLYVADSGNHLIRKITPDGMVSTISGSSYGFADGNLKNGKFYYPSGITLDEKAGLIYVLDSRNYRIRKIDIKADTVSTFAGNGLAGSVDGTGAEAKFYFYGYYSTGIAINPKGELYVTDTLNNKIRKIDQNGNVTTVTGSVYGFLDGTAEVTKFAYPTGAAVGKNGCLFVADFYNQIIRRVSD
ncbi:hypothetical protein CXB49_09990 [Chromobacterium sp. ATCC 53434]|nr:hypothetical protein CXB49_09990 [Chromobacterium sp. ATCC 53434]